MKAIRRILAKMLGLKNYLKLVSKSYILVTNRGGMGQKYPELFFLDKLIQPEWTCLDIGANLGYYSNRIGKKLTTGKLIAVEPIPLFAEIWSSNTKHLSCKKELLQYALGDENKRVSMSIPIRNGVVRHGLTKIDDENSSMGETAMCFEVELKKSESVFGALETLHFIKIDVEGYEYPILKSMQSVLEKHLPFVQAELSGKENRENAYALFRSLGYESFKLFNEKLHAISEKELPSLAQDVYFVHPNNKLGAQTNF